MRCAPLWISFAAFTLLFSACDGRSTPGRGGAGGRSRGSGTRPDGGDQNGKGDAGEGFDSGSDGDGGGNPVRKDAGQDPVENDGGIEPPPTRRDSGQPPPPPFDSGVEFPDSGPPPNGTVPVGLECFNHSECNEAAGGWCGRTEPAIPNVTFTGGYCLKTCNAGDPCPSGAACWTPPGASIAVCGDSCNSAGECRQGYECRSGSPRVCWPSNTPPPPPPPPPGMGSIGDACQADTDCSDPGAECLPELAPTGMVAFPGGYCWRYGCDLTSNPCPTGARCFTIDAMGATACLRPCTTRSDCGRTEYTCASGIACMPHCSYAPCPAGYTCDTTSGECI